MNRRNGNRLQMLLRFGMKPAILALSMVVMITSVASGSLAWLTATTPTITNTFTYGNVWIDLEESDTNKDNDNNPDTNEYPMQPGHDIDKDPKVTVFANSKDSWLFVELVESSNFSTYLEYEMATGWKQLFTETDSVTGKVRTVYYYEGGVSESSSDQIFAVLKDNKVHVKNDVQQEDLQKLTEKTYPTLEITAYAAQKTGSASEGTEVLDTPKAAWTIAIKPADLKYFPNNTQELIESAQDDDDNADSFILDDAQQPTPPEQPGSDEPQQPAGEQTQTEGEPQQPGTDESEQPNGNPPAGALVDPANPDGPSA